VASGCKAGRGFKRITMAKKLAKALNAGLPKFETFRQGQSDEVREAARVVIAEVFAKDPAPHA
jgi:hypothetical protein